MMAGRSEEECERIVFRDRGPSIVTVEKCLEKLDRRQIAKTLNWPRICESQVDIGSKFEGVPRLRKV